MIIDCHGHYTTEPKALTDYRKRQIAAFETGRALAPDFAVSDDEIRETIEKNQLRIQRSRGVDLTIFSPRAGGMAHHVGDERTSLDWTRASNDMIHRVCTLYPESFAGVCQLPQSPGVSPASCIPELARCVEELGFVGCNLNPDPSDGYWTGPPLTDRHWYPLYEKMVELDVPAMVHVRLLEVIPTGNVLFASEIVGAVKGIDPDTGYNYDDTKRYIDAVEWVSDEQRQKIYSENALRVYPRLRARVGGVN